ncbi:MAG: folate-binding protein [Pseudomonadota bacterium]
MAGTVMASGSGTGLLARHAPERRVLSMVGSDALSVLQDVLTNDVQPLEKGDPARTVYAALLTPQGKYLFDFFLLSDGDGGLLIDAGAARAAALGKRLGMYCLRRDARVAGELSMATGQLMPADPAGPLPTLPTLPDGARAVPDPRSAGLGWRLYAADTATLESAFEAVGSTPLDDAGWAARRVALAVPETDTELLAEETFPLEAGLDTLAGIDFRKGCYVGQEVTARMRHKTELKKRLVRVQVTGAAPAGTPLTTAEGKPAGTLFTQAGGIALAHLRLDRAVGPLTAGDATVTYVP